MSERSVSRRTFCVTAAAAAAALLWSSRQSSAADTPAKKPNLILILADDVGLDGLGCTGGDQYKTPRLDAFAAAGTRFTTCYANPLCGPTRGQLLTGRYPFRTGMTDNTTGPNVSPKNEIMLPRVLKDAGYITSSIGKWAQLPLEPGDFGFDEYLHFTGSGKYWARQEATYTQNGKKVQLGDRYLPDVMHEAAVEFITRNRERPFFLYYPMSHVHGPILKTPDSAPDEKETRPGVNPKLYADNIAYMDKLVGKLLDSIDQLGLRDNTLILFVGDNGTAQEPSKLGTVGGKKLSGQKNSMTEGGSRVPLIVNWKGVTPAGKTSDDLIDVSDFYSTFAELAGAKLPAGVTIDSHSFADQLKGNAGSPRDWVFVQRAKEYYVRDRRWKLTGTGELLDLKDAPFTEAPVAPDTKDSAALAAKQSLAGVLAGLNPAVGATTQPTSQRTTTRPARPRRRKAQA